MFQDTTRWHMCNSLFCITTRDGCLEIPPYGLGGSQRHKPSRFGAKNTWPERHRLTPSPAYGSQLALAPPTFWSDQNVGVAAARIPHVNQTLPLARNEGQPGNPRRLRSKIGLQRQDRSKLKQSVAPALLARRDDHLPPMGEPLFGTLGRKFQYRTLRDHWNDGSGAEFDRLLNDQIHLVTARQRLDKGDANRRLAVTAATFRKARSCRLSNGDENPRHFASLTVKEHQRITWPQTQDALGMVGHIGRELEILVLG